MKTPPNTTAGSGCPATTCSASDWPECSGDPASCPENNGYGCGKPNPQPVKACGWTILYDTREEMIHPMRVTFHEGVTEELARSYAEEQRQGQAWLVGIADVYPTKPSQNVAVEARRDNPLE